MPDAVSPLAGRAFAAMPGATLAERPLRSLVQVAAWPGTRAAVDAALRRASLPPLPEPRRATRAAGATALDIGPGAALIADGPADAHAVLAAALPAEAGTVTDLGHARVRLRLEGPRAAWILGRGIQIDLHPDAFAVDACAQTQFGPVGVTLHRAGPEAWDLLAYRGFALSLAEALEVAGRADVPA